MSFTSCFIGCGLIALSLSGCSLSSDRQSHAQKSNITGAKVIAQAKQAYDAWLVNPQDSKTAQSYNYALADLIRWLDKVPVVSRSEVCETLGIEIDFAHETELALQQIIPASDVDKSILDHWHDTPGVGVPVVAWRKNDNSGKWDGRRPPEGIAVPMTVLLTPTKANNEVWKLKFYDPYYVSKVSINGKDHELASDLSSPFALIIKKAEALRKSGRSGMLNPGASERKEKLYLIQPYDPNRIPLLMVHGLQSTPVTFGNLSCQIAADRTLYKRYQIWHYHYPTGAPVLANAAVFRQELKNALLELDPEGDDFATRNLFVIGHSMGGILTHTLTCDSDYKLWDSVLKSRPDKFVCSPEFKTRLEPVFLFKQEKRVKRVIFVAVPHRGSSYADNWIGDLGQQLYRGNHAFHGVFSELIKNHRDQINPFLLKLVDSEKVSSIRTLSSRSPALMALSDIPPRVPFHNIMGQKKPGPKEQGSDGIVPYTSSRMDGAVSELIVQEGHNAFRHPDAVEEIKRILHLHINSKYTPSHHSAGH